MRTKKAVKEILAYLAEDGSAMIDAFFPRHYPEAHMARQLLGLDLPRAVSRAAARHSFASLLSHLKKQGLIARAGTRRKSIWSITSKGRAMLKKSDLRNDKLEYDLPPEDGVVRLVTFDIPEKERRKRNWLRIELLACGFTAIQKSVYLGKRPLPEKVIMRIGALNLTRHIQIIGIEKLGTLLQQI